MNNIDYPRKLLNWLCGSLILSFSFFEINTINNKIKAEKNLIAASEKDLFLYRQMGASYLCIASKAEVDFNKGLGIASATFANVIMGKHGGIIEELGKEKLNENYTIVNSILKATSERPEIKIDWRIYTKNLDNPLIRDLIIEGLSLARTQKEEFASVLNSNNNDIEALFKVLEEFSQN